MSAGTLTLTNNTDAVTGTDTTFTTELVAGDFIVAKVGGITYTLPVKTVGSDTQAVLVSKYPGPTLAGIAWQAVPRESQNQVTAELVAQTTAALRGLNYDKQNWQAVFSASGDITVVLPDGSTFTGPSWQSIKDTLALIDIDAVTALANQVHTDAQHVAADKTTATQAAATATQAKTDSQTAQAAAEAAASGAGSSNASAAQHASDAAGSATAAAGSATAAANSAASVHPENMLHKDQNLDDLADKSAARSNLDIYSKSEVDDAIANAGTGQTIPVNKGGTGATTAAEALTNLGAYSKAEINARIDHAVIDVGNVAVSSRTVKANPFGNNVPVIVQAEVLVNGVWADSGFIYAAPNGGYGTLASYVEGVGIVVQVGSAAVCTIPTDGGGGHGSHSIITAPTACRVHVWKVTA